MDLLWDVPDPTRLAPRVQAVLEWLQSGAPSATEVVPTGDYIIVTMPAAAAERLFGVELVRYVRRAKEASTIPQFILRAREQKYSLPAHIAELVYSVSGLVDFPPLVKSYARPLSVSPPLLTRVSRG
jgi:hypothetical protein